MQEYTEGSFHLWMASLNGGEQQKRDMTEKAQD